MPGVNFTGKGLFCKNLMKQLNVMGNRGGGGGAELLREQGNKGTWYPLNF